MKPRIMVMCPRARDVRELTRIYFTDRYDIVFCSFNYDSTKKITSPIYGELLEGFDGARVVDYFVREAQCHKVDAIICSEDYPGSILYPLVVKKCGVPGPSLQSVLACHHKYESRKKQQQFVPEATPWFACATAQVTRQVVGKKSFPLFVKPIKSCFSIGSHVADSYEHLQNIMNTRQLPPAFFDQFNWFLSQGSDWCVRYDEWLIEELLDGVQVTIEGFVFHRIVTILGVIDSFLYPGTLCFSRFEYPSSLSLAVQNRMAKIAMQFMQGIGFDGGFFNIEMMYNVEKDTISIIEVNSRMASQFADLYEKVDGYNSYIPCIELALGHEPQLKKGAGKHAVAASLVMREFENKRVLRAPGQDELAQLYCAFPDVRVQLFAQQGDVLDDVAPQDGYSYLVGLIHLGAGSQQELLLRFEQAKQILNFKLELLC